MSNLFKPKQVGDITLQHRVVLSPSTRYRSDANHVVFPYVAEYYGQRSSQPGTLLITEATHISLKSGVYTGTPGIWSDEQVAGWKKVTDKVHENGSFIYLQLWAIGRSANPDQLRDEGNIPYVGASEIKHPDYPTDTPRALTIDEIQEYKQMYVTAASNAVHRAGFDGVEVHGANSYLIDQFIQTNTNNRTDEYGGSIENRSRFALEVTQAVVDTVGQSKTGIRLSPWNSFGGMRMPDPKPTFSYLVTKLRDTFPNLAYLHVVEPRFNADLEGKEHEGISNDFIREIWGDRPLISAGGYNRDLAIDNADKKGDIIAFARSFIANPDLPYRLEHDIPFNTPDRSRFYGGGEQGYVDYPFAERK